MCQIVYKYVALLARVPASPRSRDHGLSALYRPLFSHTTPIIILSNSYVNKHVKTRKCIFKSIFLKKREIFYRTLVDIYIYLKGASVLGKYFMRESMIYANPISDLELHRAFSPFRTIIYIM